MRPYLNIRIQGHGPDLVLLHGWGVNNAVFDNLIPSLSNYRVHNVDLPGFGESDEISGDIDNWCSALIAQLPNNAIWLGWSLGGLVATKLALTYPQAIRGLITLCSSPCFEAEQQQNWPGIDPNVLAQFSQQLMADLPKTIERFLGIQAMGTESAKQDIRNLKKLLLAKPLPSHCVLEQGLNMLKQVDLRKDIAAITCPWLRVWGRLDALVPHRIIPKLPQSDLYQDLLLHKASHAPFISHKQQLEDGLLVWLNRFL